MNVLKSCVAEVEALAEREKIVEFSELFGCLLSGATLVHKQSCTLTPTHSSTRELCLHSSRSRKKSQKGKFLNRLRFLFDSESGWRVGRGDSGDGNRMKFIC